MRIEMKKHTLLIALVMLPMLVVAAENDPVAEANFRKAIKAAGGDKRFNAIKAPTMWMEQGTYHAIGKGVPFVAQYASYWPRRWYRQLVEGQFAIGIAGEQATLFAGRDGKGQKLSGPKLKSALHQIRIAWAQLLYPLMEDDYTLTDLPGVKVDGRPTVGIRARHESGSEVKLFFDKRTFLLAKTEAEVSATQLGGKRVRVETFCSEHKPFGKVKLPSHYRTLFDGKLFAESRRIAVKAHATVDPAWFGTTGPARVR